MMFAWLFQFWWVLSIGAIAGVVLLFVVAFCNLWWTERKDYREWQEQHSESEEEIRRQVLRGLRDRIGELERKEDADREHIKHLQIQNAGQAQVLIRHEQVLGEISVRFDRQNERIAKLEEIA